MKGYFKLPCLVLIVSGLISCNLFSNNQKELDKADHACIRVSAHGLPPLADNQTERFLGKVTEDVANCRGGQKAMDNRDSVWLDWSNYWGGW